MSENIKEAKRKTKQGDWPGIRLMKWCREFTARQRKEDWFKFLQGRFQ